MKLLYWLLPLALLMFAMPVLGADIGPPGDVVIELGTSIDPPDPAPVIAANIFDNDTDYADLGTMLNRFEHIAVTAQFTSDSAYALLRLRQRQPEGGVAFRRSGSSGGVWV